MLIVTILVGFVMMTLGVALLLLGEVPFVAGKRISAVRSRLIGGVLVGFLPLALGVKTLGDLIFGRDAVEGPVVTALTFSFCGVVAIVILFRVMVPKREPRKAAPASAGPAKENPFGDAASEPANAPPAKKSRKPAAEDTNPFDFKG